MQQNIKTKRTHLLACVFKAERWPCHAGLIPYVLYFSQSGVKVLLRWYMFQRWSAVPRRASTEMHRSHPANIASLHEVQPFRRQEHHPFHLTVSMMDDSSVYSLHVLFTAVDCTHNFSLSLLFLMSLITVTQTFQHSSLSTRSFGSKYATLVLTLCAALFVIISS